MSTFDIYVHGTPRGHQIWGSEHSHDYISTFYNHDTQASEKAVLHIEVCGGDSFYTYMRHQNVYDVEGRPQAFFALTVGFRKAFCTNVYRLYQLFDAVYNQICVGSILKQSGNGANFLVADLTTARSGANATVDKIQAAFTQKIAELIVPSLQTLSSGDTFNKSKKIVSLLEVDSPLFFEYFKKYSVVVSPNTQPSAIAFDAVSNELRQITAQKNALSSSNDQLQSDVIALTQENKSLSSQLHASASSTEKKYKGKIDQLQSDLINITKERDSLKQKIHEATSSIELIDQPFQKLTRLLAGRFPESRAQKHDYNLEDKQETSSKHQTPVRRDWLNTVLLCLVLVCCCGILFLILKNNYTQTSSSSNELNNSTPQELLALGNAQTEEAIIVNSAETEGSDEEEKINWSDYKINVKHSQNGIVLKDILYELVVCNKDWEIAQVPNGTWLIDKGDFEPITLIESNKFKIPNDLPSGTNLLVKYMYNNQSVITRHIKVK